MNTHITHAHQNIVNVQNISDKNEMGTNKADTSDINDQKVMGINEADTSSINTHTATTSDILNANNAVTMDATTSTSSTLKEPAVDVKPKRSPEMKPDYQGNNSRHKRRPKPKGKHNRPQLAPISQDTQEPSEEPKKINET